MSDVNCPHCNAVQETDYWFEYGGHDGACFDIKCLGCKKFFDVSASLIWKYTVVEDEVLDDE